MLLISFASSPLSSVPQSSPLPGTRSGTEWRGEGRRASPVWIVFSRVSENITLLIMEEESRIEPYIRPEARDQPQPAALPPQRPVEDWEAIPANTLDDGICRTLYREMASMFYKFSFVLVPRSSKGSARLRNWDLWGPFFMCLVFGLFINNSTQFLVLFGAVFGGAMIVTFNTRILGGRISYFQSVSILGYCVFPLFLIILLLKVLSLVGVNSMTAKLLGVVIAAVWGVFSAQAFIAFNIAPEKRFVSLYPICLFYLFIGLLVLYM